MGACNAKKKNYNLDQVPVVRKRTNEEIKRPSELNVISEDNFKEINSKPKNLDN